MTSERSLWPDSCRNTACRQTVASLEHQVGKTAVKVSRLERQLRQREEEVESQKQQKTSAMNEAQRLQDLINEMSGSSKAVEAATSQHMHMKDSPDKHEAPAPVLQLKLHQEREKVLALQLRVKSHATSSMVLRDEIRTSNARQAGLADDLKRIEAFVNDYHHTTQEAIHLSKGTISIKTGDKIRVIRDLLQQIEEEGKKLPDEMKARMDQILELRDESARRHALVFTNGRITKLEGDTVSHAMDGCLETRELNTQPRQPSISTGTNNITHADDADRREADSHHHQPGRRHSGSLQTSAKRSQDNGAAGDMQTENHCGGGGPKRVKTEDAGQRAIADRSSPDHSAQQTHNRAPAHPVLPRRDPRHRPGRGGKRQPL